MTLRGDLIEKLLVKIGNESMRPLLPKLPTDDVLEACALAEYPTLMTLPMSHWPEPQAMSIVFGKTQGLIFDTPTGIGQAAFVGGLSRGAAVIGTILVTEHMVKLQEIMSDTMPPIAIGDKDIPIVAPWLVRPLIESAANIIEKTDTLNLRDVLAFNYGVFWAACAIVPPKHEGRQTKALEWLQAVTEYFGGLGIVPQ
jgi:hypothetical protein